MVLKLSGFPTYRTNQIAVKGPARDVAGGVFALNESDMDNLEVDYDNNVTDLYKYISNCQWNEALHTIASQPIEARTWVVRYHEDENTAKDGTTVRSEERRVEHIFPDRQVIELLRDTPESRPG